MGLGPSRREPAAYKAALQGSTQRAIRRADRDLTFTGNLAGHTIQVIFADGSSYPDTVIRFRSVSLIQY